MSFLAWIGLIRSFVIYYGNPIKYYQLRSFYSPFVSKGELCFDIGAHVGNRSRIFFSLGAKVIALEPQPHVFKFISWLYKANKNIIVLQKAVGAVDGEMEMQISQKYPTVSSLSNQWVEEVKQTDGGFKRVIWDRNIIVDVITLDSLIDQYGIPEYCKIDVEGYELEVLKGLSRPIPLLSFEFVWSTKEIALICIDHLTTLSQYRYNYVFKEWGKFSLPEWVSSEEMKKIIRSLSSKITSGDIYARIEN